MTKVRLLMLLLLGFAGASALATTAAAQATTFQVSLEGPAAFVPGVPATYGGRLTLGRIGLPSQSVDIVVDGVVAGTSVTDIDGAYSLDLVFTTPSAHRVHAVWQRGTIVESRSPALTVQPVRHEISVLKTGTGEGTVSSTPAGINCGPDCDESFVARANVTLRAHPRADSVFESWSGACTGAATCTLTVDRPATAIASFRDVRPPDAPAFLATTPASPANENSPRVFGLAESGSRVRLYTSDCFSAPVASGSAEGFFSPGLSVSVPDDSTIVFRATSTDAAGNTSACSAPITFVEDSTAPQAPAIRETIPPPPANENAPRVAGLAESETTVTIYSGAGCSGAASATGSAAQFASPGLAISVPDDSATALRATATDPAGNASPCSAPITYVEDSTPPSSPSLSVSPNGPANDNSPRVSGTAEAGSTVLLYVFDCSGTPLATLTPAELATGRAVTVEDNTHTTFRATAVDAAGNVSSCSSGVTYVEDSKPPSRPFLRTTSPPSPRNENLPLVIGYAEPGSTVRLYASADCSGPPVATGTAATLASPGIQVSVLDDTTTDFRAIATDAAGNESSCAAPITYVEDSIAPASPVLTGTSPPSPANENFPYVLGSAEAGSTVELYFSALCHGDVAFTGTAEELASSGIRISVDDNFTYKIGATATDAAGNISPCARPWIVYREDSLPPAVPVLTGTSPPSPANDNEPEVLGSAEPGSYVRVYKDAACSLFPETGSAEQLATSGITMRMSDNSSAVFYAQAIDAAGNASGCSSGIPYVEDSIAPQIVLSGTSPSSPANDNAPEILGTTEPGATVRIYTGFCWATQVGEGTGAELASPGITVAVVDNSTNGFYAAATDAAGNGSSCSNFVTYVEDSIPPPAPMISATSPPSPANNNNPKVRGTAEAGSTVKIYTTPDCSGPQHASGTASVFGGDGIVTSVANDTTVIFRATVSDAARNVSGCSSGIAYTEDSVAPAPPALSGTNPPSPGNDNTPEVLGTVEAGSTVRVYTGSGCVTQLASGTAADLVSPGLTVSLPDNSSTTFYASAEDAAGNKSACAAGVTYVEDSIPPSFAGATSASAASTTSVALGWTAGSDGVTPVSALVYDVCRATTAGACSSSFVVSETSGPGATARTVGSLSEGTRYIFVVRARDQAGNRDANTVEVSVRTLGQKVVRSVTGGDFHTCAVVADGSARCWGFNIAGQVGDGTTTNRYAPVSVSGLAGAEEISGGRSRHTCALIAGGTVRCWGNNSFGQLGDGTVTGRTTPVQVTGLTGASAVSIGLNHSCALRAGGTVHCWGNNVFGQLGDGTTTTRFTPVQVTGISNVIGVAAGSQHTCAVLGDRSVRCWGRNASGQLGDGTVVSRSAPVSVSGITEAVRLTAGYDHTCAALATGTARCWGANGQGQLGDGTNLNRESPVLVSGLAQTEAIEAGGNHTCALNAFGGVKCWGNNADGQLGDGTTTARNVPAPVSLMRVKALGLGGSHSCAVLADGTARCWGLNSSGQLGIGSGVFSRLTPDVVTALTGSLGGTQIAAGSSHTCGVISDGSARCWGWNARGQLGDGSTTYRTVPVEWGSAAITAIAPGGEHTCARDGDGRVLCAGGNDFGQLGDGTTASRATPAPANLIPGAVAIASGRDHSCALASDGTVHCWGSNSIGQLGDGTFTNRTAPVVVAGLGTAVAIGAGEHHTCAVLAAGTVRCWGGGTSGELGDGTFSNRATPTAVSGLTNVVSVALGQLHTCALLADGTGRCWGANWGQIGDGTTITRSSPVAVSGLAEAVGIDLGDGHTCAVLADGSARCWGGNWSGEVGDGTTTSRLVPTPVSGLGGAVGIGAGGSHSCALVSDGTARCWGGNSLGQLGDGTSAGRLSPVVVGAFP